MVNLYQLSVVNYNRVLNASIGILDKAQARFEENNQDMNEIIEMRLADDMRPFPFQINSIRHHSLNSVKGLIAGEFRPPEPLPELDYQGLRAVLVDAQAELTGYTEDQINELEGNSMCFRTADLEIPFTSENFVQSFSLPNLHFHATTLYDMLRIKGAPLGKADYLGKMAIGTDELAKAASIHNPGRAGV